MRSSLAGTAVGEQSSEVCVLVSARLSYGELFCMRTSTTRRDFIPIISQVCL
jgi:hypothetical protein